MDQVQSQDISALIEALSLAQGEIEGADKDGKNPHFKSTYSSLTSTWDACRAPLSKNGLAIIQMVETHNDKYYLTTTLAHKSGQWMRSYFPLLLTKMDSQGLGSAVTYARRYSLMAMIGVCPTDDDGEAATDRSNKAPARRTERDTSPATISLEQAETLKKMFKSNPNLCKELLAYIGVGRLTEIPAAQYNWVVKEIEECQRIEEPKMIESALV